MTIGATTAYQKMKKRAMKYSRIYHRIKHEAADPGIKMKIVGSFELDPATYQIQGNVLARQEYSVQARSQSIVATGTAQDMMYIK